MIFFSSASTAALGLVGSSNKRAKNDRGTLKPTRKSPQPCSRMASTFYRLISLGSFVFVRHDIPEVGQFSISSAILKSANLV